MNDALIALIAALAGGGVTKLIESLFGRDKAKQDIATTIRNELRTEVTELRDELRRVEYDLDRWKTRFYKMLNTANSYRLRLVKLGVSDAELEILDVPIEPHQKD